MKFAIISDIHGNLPSLNAVLEDAERNGAESYIFVGDYIDRGIQNKEVLSCESLNVRVDLHPHGHPPTAP